MPSRRDQQQRDVARFDQWSERYDRSWLQRVFFGPVHAHVIAVANQAVPQPRTVLDVGCGTGRLLQRLAQAYPTAQLAGLDAAPGMAVVAARRHRIAAVVGVAEHLPFRTRSVQLLVSTISFHHWGDQRRGLAEVRRVLAPGGHLLLTDPVVTGWLRPFFALVRARDRFHTAAELDAMLGDAGLRPRRRSPVPGTWGAVAVTVAMPA
ncbi:MAG TPA: methyltransferase domain-containing protein [Actinomycetes bacterium]|nr:methyltransferase domain-containing protein [Actinomycetes bacterium]